MDAPVRTAVEPDHPILSGLIEQLDLYFSGEPVRFSVPLDPAYGTPFRRRVWEQLTFIPWGETRSYGEIATAVGNTRASRAVGTANKNNPIPILIPCHRVIKADGSLGGYNSGLDIKRRLLALEGIQF
jgi:methylated-DNA-[protein]-cysteine S-methyltransferase